MSTENDEDVISRLEKTRAAEAVNGPSIATNKAKTNLLIAHTLNFSTFVSNLIVLSGFLAKSPKLPFIRLWFSHSKLSLFSHFHC